MIKIKKGVDLPLLGEPTQTIEDGPRVATVGLVGNDYVGMKPAMAVREGDTVKLGQMLFEDRKAEGVRYTSPGSGTVVAINRGQKRIFQSLVIELAGDDEETFDSYLDGDLTTLTREQVRDNLVASGLWTSLRSRPFSKVPLPNTTPHSLFISAIDTNPLAPKPEVVIAEDEAPFIYGLQVLRHLTTGNIYLCKAPQTRIPGAELDFITVEEFAGPHPAGLPGTHIHYLDPVNEKKTVWHINYQDVIAVGKLFVSGRLSTERVVSLAGPGVNNPRLLRTRVGANIDDLVEGELAEGKLRVISGSVFAGRASVAPLNYLGRYHHQVSVVAEAGRRVFLGWQSPGFNKFSVTRLFASSFLPNGRKFQLSTSIEGSRRAMVPIGTYEKVLPLDLIPTFLLRALIVGDTEQARALGCLELDEEDLALCTFVCPGKYEYGPLLRRSLNQIEKEG